MWHAPWPHHRELAPDAIIRTASIRAACYLRPLGHAPSLPHARQANMIAFAFNVSYDNDGGGHLKLLPHLTLLPLLGHTLIV